MVRSTPPGRRPPSRTELRIRLAFRVLILGVVLAMGVWLMVEGLLHRGRHLDWEPPFVSGLAVIVTVLAMAAFVWVSLRRQQRLGVVAEPVSRERALTIQSRTILVCTLPAAVVLFVAAAHGTRRFENGFISAGIFVVVTVGFSLGLRRQARRLRELDQ